MAGLAQASLARASCNVSQPRLATRTRFRKRPARSRPCAAPRPRRHPPAAPPDPTPGGPEHRARRRPTMPSVRRSTSLLSAASHTASNRRRLPSAAGHSSFACRPAALARSVDLPGHVQSAMAATRCIFLHPRASWIHPHGTPRPP
jgi:hypothetical protein